MLGRFDFEQISKSVLRCSTQPGKKIESGSLFNANMPAPLWIGDCVIVRDTYTMFYYMLEEGEMDPNDKLFKQNWKGGIGV